MDQYISFQLKGNQIETECMEQHDENELKFLGPKLLSYISFCNAYSIIEPNSVLQD